jgi:hypothetical protein
MSFSSVNIEGKKAAPDRIYYNGTVVNNTLLTTQSYPDPEVRFQDQRQNPLVPDSSNYEVSVQNFSLNGCSKTLPLFIPQISPGITGGTITDVVVQYAGGVTGPENVITYTTSNTISLTRGCLVNSVSISGSPQYSFSSPQTVYDANATSFSIRTDLPISSVYSVSGTASWYNINDITTTIYSVSVGIGTTGGTYGLNTQYVIWEPENVASYTVVPPTANPVQIESPYYYSYSYTHFISLVNKALNKAWVGASGGTGGIGTQCPFFEFDEASGLFSLNQDANTCMVPYGTTLPAPYNVSSSVSGYKSGEYTFVGMNTCLQNLLTNFNSIYYGTGAKWGSSNYTLPESVINMGLPINLQTAVVTQTTPVGVSLRTQPKTSFFQLVNPFTAGPIATSFYVRLPQDFVSTGTIWSPIASFVLATTQLPLRNEATANPIAFGSKNVGGQNGNGGAFQKVLIETPIDALKADYWKGWVLYEPKTLTFSSLDPSHDGISDVDVNLFWRNRLTNSLIPVTVPNQGSMSFRLLFKKKLVL